jgi:Domain of unknown function (DUF4105)
MFATVLNFLFLVILLLIAKAPNSWGFSVSRTESYVQQAKQLKLWQEAKWIKLGHYEKSLFGHVSAFSGSLFINESGPSSPEKELISTIQALFSESLDLTKKYNKHPQCHFLARRKWLTKQLKITAEDILPCQEQQTWKQNLNAKEVSVIFASADLGNPASSFGHTFIKLINPENSKNKDLIDYGVNYAAIADESDGLLYAVRGLLGAYRGVFTMLPYHQKIREYINLEGRDITEYKLNFTPEEVDELIDHLNELENTSAPYFYFSDNCSYQILNAFDVIRPNLKLSDQFNLWVIPADTIKAIARHPDQLIIERKFKKSLRSEYEEGYAKLGLLQRKALDEAVKNLIIPEDYELTKKEKAEVYETAMRYYAIEAYSGKKVDDKKYALESERALLGQQGTELTLNKDLYPELSHDSSALYLGAGNANGTPYTLLKFRSSFHDLEQNDRGQVPMSLVHAGVFEFRYYDELKKFSLNRFSLINLLNTSPVTQLEKNISWKARVEIVDQFKPDIEYAGGFSYDIGILNRSRISYLISAGYLKTKPNEKIGLSINLSYLGQSKNQPYLRFKTKLNYELYDGYDIQLSGDDQKDYQFSVLKNFIL